MDRLACVEVPVLPLQLLLRARPQWREGPVAVVVEDAPLGLITHVNEAARRHGVVPGLKYGEALSLCAPLHAAVVDAQEIEDAVSSMLKLLRDWSPAIEASRDEAGVFWLEAHGLSQVFPSLEAWGAQVLAVLKAAGWRASLCVGFTRFGSYAVTKALRVDVAKHLTSPEEEKRLLAQVPLRRVGLEPRALMALEKLGVTTLGGFLALPVGGLRKRYGEVAERLALSAAGKRVEPFQPTAAVVPVQARLDFDEPVLDSNQLIFASLAALRQLMQSLAERQLALRTLTVTLELDRPKGVVNEPIVLNVALAEATQDGARVTEQVRLTLAAALARIEKPSLPAPAGRGPGRGATILTIIEGAAEDSPSVVSTKPALRLVEAPEVPPAPLPNPLPADAGRGSFPRGPFTLLRRRRRTTRHRAARARRPPASRPLRHPPHAGASARRLRSPRCPTAHARPWPPAGSPAALRAAQRRPTAR